MRKQEEVFDLERGEKMVEQPTGKGNKNTKRRSITFHTDMLYVCKPLSSFFKENSIRVIFSLPFFDLKKNGSKR